MIGWLGGAYLWVKAAHIVFVIFWIAAQFALGRYLVHHSGAPPGSDEDAAWAKRSRLLRHMILTPSILMVWLIGIALVLNIGLADQGWLHAKLVVVLALSGWHGWAVATSKKLSRGERPYGDRTLRLWGEAPALGVIAAVVLAVVKPF